MNIIKILKDKFLNKEFILYTIFGFATMIVGVVIYQLFLYLNVDYKIANLFSLILGKLFAYVVNKLFVFKSKTERFVDWLKEFFRFIVARGATGLIDYFGVIIAVEIFGLDKVISKYILQVIVIILNYFLGKKIVFKN